MNFEEIKKDLKKPMLRTNGNGGVTGRWGIKSISLIIVLLGFFARGAIFYAQTCDTTKTVKTLKRSVTELQIEKTVNDTITTEYVQELIRAVMPEKEAEATIKRLEANRTRRMEEWKRQLLEKPKDKTGL